MLFSDYLHLKKRRCPSRPFSSSIFNENMDHHSNVTFLDDPTVINLRTSCSNFFRHLLAAPLIVPLDFYKCFIHRSRRIHPQLGVHAIVDNNDTRYARMANQRANWRHYTMLALQRSCYGGIVTRCGAGVTEAAKTEVLVSIVVIIEIIRVANIFRS